MYLGLIMTEANLTLLIDIEFDEEPLGAGGKPASAFRLIV
jgi:hypothetical protein